LSMSQNLTIEWRQESPSIYAAYLTDPREWTIYVGYVATNPDDEIWWRGYLGIDFTPVGRGPRAVMQTAVEQRGREMVGQEMEAREGDS